MRRVLLFPAAFVAFLAITALPARGQSQDPRQDQQAPIFRGGVQTVALYATVTDESGRLVPDLQQKDFDIYDNGKLQTITVFKSDVQPVTVLLTLDTSGSMTMTLDLLKDAAEAFVIRLLPFDRARITNFDDKIVTSPEFTSDRDELIRYIHEDVGYGNGTRLWDAVDNSMSKLASVQGRRVVLLFTDGDDEGSRLSTYDAVTKRAESEDFMIYSIGLESHVLGITTHPDKGIRRLADAFLMNPKEISVAPPASPALTMFTYRRSNALGCLANDSLSVLPDSTSSTTSIRAFFKAPGFI